MRHRGISLKTIGVKRFMTWHQGTHYLFLNSVRYRKMSPGIPGRGVSEVERHIMDKGYGGRNLVAGSLEDVSGVAEPS